MKNIFPIIILAITLLTSTFTINNAEDFQPGDIIGHVYATDIKAFIDDMPIPSYNIGGKTVVSEFDLHNYGFDIVWDADNRVLEINSGTKPEEAPLYSEKEYEAFGSIIADVYYTDIIVIFNEYVVPSYNIGGETLICLEDLGREVEDTRSPNHNREIGYSNLGVKTIWNPESRTINAYTLNSGNILATEHGNFKIINFITGYDLVSADFHPHYLSTFFIDGDDYHKIQHLSINDLFTFEELDYTFKNSQLFVKKRSILENRFYSTTAHMDDYNAILPVIEIPVQLTNEDNTISNFTLNATLCKGEPYISVYDLKESFDITYKKSIN